MATLPVSPLAVIGVALALGSLACGSGGTCGATGAGGAGRGGFGNLGGSNGSAGGGGGTGTNGSAGRGGGTGTNGSAGRGGGTCVSPVIPLPPTGCPDVSGAPLGVASHPSEGTNHLVACSTACYLTMPPSSGNHYPTWPAYKTYDQPVPWGFLVHGLEHGAMIVVYNCPCGCPDEVAAAQTWIAGLPTDAACGAPPRIVLAPDPTLDVRWGASAWDRVSGGWTLRAASFDQQAFQAFFTAHYDQGPESICGGFTDGSVAGWCN